MLRDLILVSPGDNVSKYQSFNYLIVEIVFLDVNEAPME